MNDFIPERDAEFAAWLSQLAEQLAKPGAPQLPANLAASIQAAASAFPADLRTHVEAHTAAAGARQTKDGSRHHGEMLARQAARILQADPTVTDSWREALGLPVHDRIRTPVGPPQTPPQVLVDASQRFQHRIRFRDAGPPIRRARPKGTVGCEVWMAIDADGDAGSPATAVAINGTVRHCPDGMTMVGLATAPLTVQFGAEQVGRTARYQLRWVNRRGQVGPWSADITATVPG